MRSNLFLPIIIFIIFSFISALVVEPNTSSEEHINTDDNYARELLVIGISINITLRAEIQGRISLLNDDSSPLAPAPAPNFSMTP